MTSNQLTTREHSPALALNDDQTWWSERQRAGLSQMGVEGAADGDLLVFLHVCQRTGLDPFARQIHMVSRNQKEGDRWVKKWTIQTGIDGYRLIARRAANRGGESLEYDDVQWADAEGNWADVWLRGTAPTAAKVVLYRDGRRFSAVALYREYVQTKRDGEPNSMWSRMPANQLAKCAEALALRKAYPQDLAGIYADDEMGQADRPEPTRVTAEQSGADRMRGVLNTGVESEETAVEPEEPSRLDGRSALSKRMHAGFRDLGFADTDRDQRLAYAADVVGRELSSSTDLTVDEASRVVDAIQADLGAAQQSSPDDATAAGEPGDPWADPSAEQGPS